MGENAAPARRRVAGLLGVAALAGALTACGAGERADARQAGAVRTSPYRFTLPAPTGPYAIATTELHLVDRSRPDPWVKGRTRELMVSVWYPARRTAGPRAPYMRPGAAARFDQGASQLLGIKPGSIGWAGVATHAASSAPATGRNHPVVLYSPGFGVERTRGTVLVEELASRGYVVVTMDHTYETADVEFPGGRVEVQNLPPSSVERQKTAMATRVRDTRFVLDRLTALRNGRNPDAEHRALPAGLGRALDLSRIGMFGHSAGGIGAAQAMDEDRRIDAGVDMDGTMRYSGTELLPVAEHGLDRPFLLLGAQQTHRSEPSWGSFWDRSTGWKLDLNVPQAKHYTFTDDEATLPQIARRFDVSKDLIAGWIGTVDSARIVAAERAYLRAFFDEHLRHRPQRLLDGPSPRHPDVVFVR